MEDIKNLLKTSKPNSDLKFQISNFKFQISFFFLILFTSCNSNYVPKPAGYPRIAFPAKSYRNYVSECPFSFRYPAYAVVAKDSSVGAEPCFLDMKFPQFNATIHLTYKSVSSFKNFHEMSEDARTFAYKHTVKAEDILDSVISRPNKVSGMFYDIEGNTASSLQFYVTDSVHHYIRAALYFNAHPNKDSLAPVIRFIHQDMDTMIRSMRWK